LPENVNYAVKSNLLLSFLESVPDVDANGSCITFCWFKEKKARDGKGMEAHWRKTGLSVKPLIYLGKINGSPQK